MDFRIESGLINVTLVVFLSISIFEVLDFLIKKDYTALVFANQTYQSSIWCWGEDIDHRKCRAVNLCYQSNHRQWIFIDGPGSVQSGLPRDRFRPALVSLSSLTGHNHFHFNYVAIESRSFKPFSSQYQTRMVKGKTFIFARFKPDNLMHALHDDIIPLKWTLDGLGFDGPVNLFMYDDWPLTNPLTNDIYEKILRPENIYTKTMEPDKLICFSEVYIGLDRETIWYQYGFDKPQGPLNKTSHQKANIVALSEKLRSHFKPKQCPEDRFGVFLSRSFNRIVLNEDNLVQFLNQKVKPFIKLNVNDNLVHLIERISCSNSLIGVHGSTLILSIFLPAGSSIVEIFPFGINPDHYTPYKTLASILGTKYIPWVNPNLSNSVQHPEYPITIGGIDNLPSEMRLQIKDLHEDLEPHLCCYDPNWLYRVYQDTIVDLDHFHRTVVPSLNQVTEQPVAKPSIEPWPVTQIKCYLVDEATGYQLNWSEPWNIVFTDEVSTAKVTNYEVLVDLGEGKGRSFVTPNKSLTIASEARDNFTFWVRCILNGIKGPFSFSNCTKNKR